MATIRERILARRDLDAMRAVRDITGLAAALNGECVPAMIPVGVNLASVLYSGMYPEVVVSLVQDAAAGQDVSTRAQELLSDEGVEVLEPGFVPAMTNQFQVGQEMYYPDGSER